MFEEMEDEHFETAIDIGVINAAKSGGEMSINCLNTVDLEMWHERLVSHGIKINATLNSYITGAHSEVDSVQRR